MKAFFDASHSGQQKIIYKVSKESSYNSDGMLINWTEYTFDEYDNTGRLPAISGINDREFLFQGQRAR